MLKHAGVKIVIPPKSKPHQDMHTARRLIENFLAKLKQFRAIATRYDKRAANCLGAIYLAASVIWLH